MYEATRVRETLEGTPPVESWVTPPHRVCKRPAAALVGERTLQVFPRLRRPEIRAVTGFPGICAIRIAGCGHLHGTVARVKAVSGRTRDQHRFVMPRRTLRARVAPLQHRGLVRISAAATPLCAMLSTKEAEAEQRQSRGGQRILYYIIYIIYTMHGKRRRGQACVLRRPRELRGGQRDSRHTCVDISVQVCEQVAE
jgi:hypothetical protein